MTYRTRSACGAFLGTVLLLVVAPLAKAADAIPSWVLQSASLVVPSYPAKVDSVVLLNEETVTVDATGKRVMRERGVVKVVQSGGEKLEATRFYNSKSGRIRDFQGWLIPPGGKPTPYAKNRIVDVAANQGEVYDEYRARMLECGCPTPGSVFAWEITEEETNIFTQDSFRFQHREPVMTARYSVTLPASWVANGVVFNHAPVEPQISGNSFTWELKDLPWIEQEPHSPSLAALAPRLAVSYYPPTDNRAGLAGLKDWNAVSSWLSPLVDPPAAPADIVRAKATALTDRAKSDVEKIAILADYVQKTNYVEIALNLTRAGGYTPRPAEVTLATNYGDCKDKATLLRALLKSVNIDSNLLVITSGDRSYVRPEWASPQQFNHAIIAIQVPDSIKMPTVIDQTPVGRLLIFDPTDRITPLGDLPESEQGSYALVVAGAKGALLKMPVLAPDARRIESQVQGGLDADGNLTASMQREYFGQSSTRLRYIEKVQGAEELKKQFEGGMARSIAATTVKKVVTETHPDENRLSVNLDLAADRFGQSMQGRLFILRPGMLTSGGDYTFTTKQRTAPIQLEADYRRDTVKIKLPQGYKLDELPSPAKLEGP
jgi:Domain of Unknown Function with PDB structure (DUF3857)/Transglutaminase-like superfamily